jgi:hypothetical protein
MEIWDAMVDGWTQPSNMLKTKDLNLHLNTHTRQLIKPVLHQVEDHTKLQDS